MSSAIGPARQALWEILTALSWPDDFQVAFGYPDLPKHQGLYLLGVDDGNEARALLGPQAANDERFRIKVAFKYQDPGRPEDEAPEVDLLGWETYGAVRDAVRANPTLSGTVIDSEVAAFESPGTGHPAVTEQNQHASGLLCVIEMTVGCFARSR